MRPKAVVQAPPKGHQPSNFRKKTYRQTDGRTDGQAGRQTDIHTYIQIYTHNARTYTHTYMQA